MDDVAGLLSGRRFAARRTFDVVLAATLKRHGVTTFYTRNAADFADLGWFAVVDPLASR